MRRELQNKTGNNSNYDSQWPNVELLVSYFDGTIFPAGIISQKLQLMSQLLAAAVLLNSGPLSKNVVPISQLDTNN